MRQFERATKKSRIDRRFRRTRRFRKLIETKQIESMKTDELRNKIAAFNAATKTKKLLVPTMITTFGVKRNQYSGKVQQEVVLDDLFAGK